MSQKYFWQLREWGTVGKIGEKDSNTQARI